MSKVLIKKEDHSKLIALLNQIEKDPKALPFMEPVDWKALDLQDYPKIVKRPIDISTIKETLKNKKYETYDQFFGDIQLIWDNCKNYNIAESEIYRMAEDMERMTKKMIQTLKTKLGLTSVIKKKTREDEVAKSDEDEEDDEEGEVSFDERIKFTDNVRKLKIEEMTMLIRKIQEKCPEVIDDLDSDKLQIKVDDIGKDLFEEFMEFTKHCLSKSENNQNEDAKMGNQEEEEDSKLAEDDNDNIKSEHTPAKRSRKHEEDSVSKNSQSIDDSGYGPEGKRVKTS